jgi:hypothetical protein
MLGADAETRHAVHEAVEHCDGFIQVVDT